MAQLAATGQAEGLFRAALKMANGMGVEATRVDTSEGFNRALAAAFNSKGPFLIEAVI